MRNIILILGIIFIGTGCNNKQQQEDKMANKLIAKINSVCQLTPDETNKIMPIAQNFIKERNENKEKYQNDPDSFKKANVANRSKFVDTLKTILTPDQFKELQTAFQQQKAKHDAQKDDEGEQGGAGGDNQ